MPRNYNLYLRGSVGGWDFDSGYVNYILDRDKDKEVNILVDSRGGRVDTALSVSALIRAHGNVHCHYVGLNASAATIATMGAKRISIDEGSAFLVHKCMNLVCKFDYMNADELESHIAELQKMKDDQDVLDNCIAGIYARRCKKPKDELLALMKKGGWLTPQQALEWGFVDEITSYDDDKKPEITDSVANELAAAGIPLPPIDIRKDSFIARLRKFFASDNEPAATDNGQQTTDNPSNQSQDMPELPSIAAILGGSLASAADGKLSISADQASKLEKALKDNTASIAEKDAQIAEKDTKIADLEKTVADLRKEPADDTKTITDQKTGDSADGPGDDIDDLVNQFAKAYAN